MWIVSAYLMLSLDQMSYEEMSLLPSNLQESTDGGDDCAVAIEVRPRSRLFKSFPVPPAKWTVAVFRWNMHVTYSD